MAYFITLNNPDPGFDTFVNGKAVAAEAERLSQIASSLGLKTPDDYFSLSGDDAAATVAEFDIGEDVPIPPEQWFDPGEGLAWIARLREHLQLNRDAVTDVEALLDDLTGVRERALPGEVDWCEVALVDRLLTGHSRPAGKPADAVDCADG